MPQDDAPQRICFETKLATEHVTADGFSGISLITADAEALGHGMWVDRTGVEQLAGMLVGKSLPSYITHEGALFSDRLGTEVGYFSGMHLDTEAGKLRGDFKYFKSFREHEAASYSRLKEMAEVMPENFGVSIVFSGSLVWVLEDGTEIAATSREAPEGALRGIPSVRFRRIESADFVKSPAVNADGLFDKKYNPPVDGTNDNNMADTPITFSQEDLDKALKAAADQLASDHTADLDAALAAKDEEHSAALASLAEEHQVALAEKDEAIDALSAEADELKTKLAEAEAASADALGVAPAVTLSEDDIEGEDIPAPEAGATDNDKWNQYSALLEEDADKAEAFHARYLS